MFGFLLIKKETFLIEFQTEHTKYLLFTHNLNPRDNHCQQQVCLWRSCAFSWWDLRAQGGRYEVTPGRCHPSKCVLGKHTHIHNIYKMQSLLI